MSFAIRSPRACFAAPWAIFRRPFRPQEPKPVSKTKGKAVRPFQGRHVFCHSVTQGLLRRVLGYIQAAFKASSNEAATPTNAKRSPRQNVVSARRNDITSYCLTR
jgi:hypothetical protein